MGLGKCRRVTVADIVYGVNPWEVGVEGGASFVGAAGGEVLLTDLGARGAGGRGTVAWREGAVLI